MSKKHKFDVSQIELLGYVPINFEIYNDKDNPLISDELENFDFDFETNIAYNSDDKLIKIGIKTIIKAVTKDDKKRKAGGNFYFEFIFEVANLEEFLTKEADEEDLKIDDLLIATLIGLSFSTTRGIIIARSGGTILENAILPVVNPRELY